MFPARRVWVLVLLVLSLVACKKDEKKEKTGTGTGTGVAKVKPDAPKMAAKGEGDGEGGGGENDGERPVPTADLKITVVGPEGESVFTGDKLVPMSTSTAPIGDMDTPGWTLGQILEAQGVAPSDKVVVHGAENANLILDAADFDPARTVLFIKLNRSGQLRFRVFRKIGDTYEIGGELRGIVRIEVK